MERAGFIRLLKEDFRSGPQMWTVWFCVPQEKKDIFLSIIWELRLPERRLKLNEGDCSTVTTKFLPPFFTFLTRNIGHRRKWRRWRLSQSQCAPLHHEGQGLLVCFKSQGGQQHGALPQPRPWQTPGRLTPGRLTPGRLTPGRPTPGGAAWGSEGHSGHALCFMLCYSCRKDMT